MVKLLNCLIVSMDKEKYLMLNDIEAYRISFNLSNYVWAIIIDWEHFAKRTVGEQFVESVDSISANIAEGFGRYSKKDKVKFYRYSQGSVSEALDWNQKSKVRRLIAEDQYEFVFSELKKLPKSINGLIKYTNSKLLI